MILCRVVAFDVASSTTFHLPFEKRYRKLLQGVPPDHLFLVSPSLSPSPSPLLSWLIIKSFDDSNIPAIRILCEDQQTLSTFLTWILDDAGEGAVLRRPASLYEHGRSSDLLKLKVTLSLSFKRYLCLCLLLSIDSACRSRSSRV
jgi:hypothetical protein